MTSELPTPSRPPLLLRPLDAALTKVAQHETRMEKAYVNEPHLLPGIIARSVTMWVLAITAVVVDVWVPEDKIWLILALALFIGWNLGRSAMRTLVRARAYRNGWIDGRHTMISAMSEASRRGLTIEQWLEGEMERDWEVLKRY